MKKHERLNSKKEENGSMQSIIELENNNRIILTNSEESMNHKVFFERNPNFKLTFQGENNLLIVPMDAKLMNSKINFSANNGICYLQNTRNKQIVLNLSIWENSSFIMGEGCSFNGFLNAIASENRNIIIGNRVMFSFGIWIRTSDVHVIMDIDSKKIINHGKDVVVGNDVWIGQGASLLKGAMVGSGAVLGYGSILTKKLPSNCIGSGAPVKVTKQNIIWNRQSMHNFSTEEKVDFEDTYDFENDIIYTSEVYQENTKEFLQKSLSIRQAKLVDKHGLIESLLNQPLIIKEKKQNFFERIFD